MDLRPLSPLCRWDRLFRCGPAGPVGRSRTPTVDLRPPSPLCLWDRLSRCGPAGPVGRGRTPTVDPGASRLASLSAVTRALISPSILAADFARLGEEAERVQGHADWLHVYVMDNHFVPNLTLGLPVVESLLRATSVPVDCHLMISDPDRWAPQYAEAGAGSVTFHAEAATAPVKLARDLRAAWARAGLGLRPETPVEPYVDLLPELDMLLVMTVEPGFGGQGFLDVVLPKLRRCREAIRGSGLYVWLQVDGGVSADTIERCA